MEPVNDKHRLLIENLPDAFAYHQIVTDSEGKPVDYVFLEVNRAFEEMTGLSRDSIIGKKATEVLPGIEASNFDWIGTYGEVAVIGKPICFEQYSEPLGRYYQVTAFGVEDNCFYAIFRNITDQKEIKERTKELSCLHGFSLLLRKEENNISEILEGTVRLLPSSFQYPDNVCARVTWGGREFKTGNFRSTPWKISSSLEMSGKSIGAIEVCSLEPPLQEGPSFLKEEELMLDTIAEHLRRIIEQIRGKEALQESEEKHRLLFETMSQGVIYQTADGKIVSANPAAERIFGLSFEQMQGKTSTDPHWQMIEEDGTPVPGTNHPTMIALRTGQTVGPVTKGVFHPDKNAHVWLNITVIPLFRPGKTEPLKVYATIEDITERKQAEEALNYSFQFEKLVSKISSKFLKLPSEKIDEGISYALKLTGEFFNLDRSYVFQFSADDQNRSNNHEWFAEGIEPQMDRIQNQPVGSLPWWTEQIRKLDYVHIPDVDSLPPEAGAERENFQRQGIQSLLSIPLRSKDRLIGFFGFDSVKEKKTWTEETISLLKVIGDILVNAFERHETEEKIRYMSFHDALTGLYNRYYLEEEMKRLDTERQLPISIIMVDVNGLKLVNDTYGHATGDKLLKHAADILRKSCREEDVIARWGGDEFVIFLPQTTLGEARVICERIYENSREAYVEDIPISLALGTAIKDTMDKDTAVILDEAENEMYKNKLAHSRSTRSAVLNALLKTLETKSFETEEHSQNMQAVALQLGEKLELSETELNRLRMLSNLHDIGKINIPEEVLMKKGSLSDEERELMNKHPEIGWRITRATEEFAHVADDILAHHERWDGKGYPQGLKEKNIPVLARIVAIADAYEVMKSGRPYKKPMPKEEIVAEFKRGAGTQFDPELVELFIAVLQKKEDG